jgi:hypothetical protein
MNSVDAFSLLGLASTDAAIGELLDHCGIAQPPRIAAGKIEARFAVKALGFDLNFVPAQLFDKTSPPKNLVLSNVVFFGPEYAQYGYALPGGALPCGLTFSMTREQATAILGAPSKTWENDGFIKSQRWESNGRQVLVQYSKQSKTIKTIEVLMPKPAA